MTYFEGNKETIELGKKTDNSGHKGGDTKSSRIIEAEHTKCKTNRHDQVVGLERRACRGIIATINKFGSGSFTSTNDPLRSNLVRESIQVKGKEVIQKTEDESGGLPLEEVVREAKCIGQILDLETSSEKV